MWWPQPSEKLTVGITVFLCYRFSILCGCLPFPNSYTYAGDELLSDSFPYKEIENGILWEVQGKVSLLDFCFVLLIFA